MQNLQKISRNFSKPRLLHCFKVNLKKLLRAGLNSMVVTIIRGTLLDKTKPGFFNK